LKIPNHIYLFQDILIWIKFWDRFTIPTIIDSIKEYGVDKAHFNSDLENVVKSLNPQNVFTLPNQKLPFTHTYPIDVRSLEFSIHFRRTIKTPMEIRLMKVSITTSAKSHIDVMKNSKLNVNEYQLQTVFEAYGRSCGLQFHAYYPIVAGGKRAAVLHYIENDKIIPQTSIILIDAGHEYLGYATDITRSYPASGKFSQDQRIIYQTVLNAQKSAIGTLKHGSNWNDAVSISNIRLLEGLRTNQFVIGNINEMLTNGVQRLFQPHGLGHAVGLLVHDPSSLNILSEGQVLTVEPGIYFHSFLFENANQNQKKDI